MPREPKKVLVTYPLEAMKPEQHFEVPATKTEIKYAKKAVTMFMKKNRKTEFIQKQMGNRFVTWRKK